MENIQSEIRKWAAEAIEEYLNLIKKNNWDYAICGQSDLTDIIETPEFMIIEINPGFEDKYSRQTNNPAWKLGGHDMDSEHFIRGNYPSWEDRDSWTNWQRLKSLFSKVSGGNPLDDTTKFILTNASCFSSGKWKEIAHTLTSTIPITLKLVRAAQPKRIVVCGAELPDYFKKVITSLEFEVKPSPYKHLRYGHIFGVETIFIPHPSSYTYKGDIKQLICLWSVKSLAEISKDWPVFTQQESPAASKDITKDDINRCQSEVCSICMEILGDPYENNGGNIRFKLGNGLELTLASQKGTQVGIRPLNAPKRILDIEPQSEEAKRQSCLKAAGWSSKDGHWLATTSYRNLMTGEDWQNRLRNLLNILS